MQKKKRRRRKIFTRKKSAFVWHKKNKLEKTREIISESAKLVSSDLVKIDEQKDQKETDNEKYNCEEL